MKRLVDIIGKQEAMVCGLLLLLILLAAGHSLADRSNDNNDAKLEDGTRNLNELVGQPVCTWIPALRYPPAVRDKSLSGRVLVSVFLDEDGRIVDTEVLSSDLPELFIVEALKAARLSRFRAKSVAGLATRSSVVLPFRFDALEAPKATQASSEEPEPTAPATIQAESVETTPATDTEESGEVAPEIVREESGEVAPEIVREESGEVAPEIVREESGEVAPEIATEESIEVDSVTVRKETVETATATDTEESVEVVPVTDTEELVEIPPATVPVELVEVLPARDDTSTGEVGRGATASHLTLDDAGFGLAVSNRILEDRDEQFSEGRRVYFWIAVSGSGGRDVISHVWYRNGREIQSIELTLRGSPWHTWSYKTLFAGMAGDWRVDVLDSNGHLIGSRALVCVKDDSSD